MSIQQAHLILCSNEQCSDYAVLPDQSPLGRFNGLQGQATDIWPINYLCQRCGYLSAISEKAILRAFVQTPSRSELVLYLFSNGLPDSLVHLEIYAKESQTYNAFRQTAEQAIERILARSGLWRDSYGPAQFVGIEHVKDTLKQIYFE